MANDAMIVAIDRIRFHYRKARRMRVYAVGIAADNAGKVLVTEPPASALIRHRPRRGPTEWGFVGDGYVVYQRTGGLPDILVAHLLIVRDRRGVRRAGELIRELADSDIARRVIGEASGSLRSLGGGSFAVTTAMSIVLPLAELVGEIIRAKRDRVLQVVSGSLFLDEERKEQDELTETIRSPDGNIEIVVDAFLFDAAIDEDSEADVSGAETRLRTDGLLLTERDLDSSI